MKIVKVNLRSADAKNTWTGTLKEEEYLQLLATGWVQNDENNAEASDDLAG